MKKVIYVNGEIDSELAQTLQLEIDSAIEEGVNEIEFRFNSGGGSVTSGLLIYDLISSLSNIKTSAYIYGVAASAATYGVLACDESSIAPNGQFMVHEPCGGLYGDIETLENDLEYFAGLRNQILAIYAAKTGMTPDEIVAKWKPSWYMSANEAVEYKFVDRVANALFTNQAENGVQDSPETPHIENEAKKLTDEIGSDMEDSGDDSVIFSLKNIVKKCKEIIKRPIVDEYDEAADLQNKLNTMAAEYEALKLENQSIKDAMEANVAELKNKLAEVENERTTLFNAIEEQKKNIETTISNEVNARIAALGYDEEELADPVNTVEETNIADVVRNQGLDAAITLMINRRVSKYL